MQVDKIDQEYINLIIELVDKKVLKSNIIIKAFQNVSRADFLLFGDKDQSALNEPIGIGHGQTNSQPQTVAFMLELLEPREGDKVLDVGCGSGWTTVLLAHIVGEQGKVLGIEIIKELVEFARNNISKYYFCRPSQSSSGETVMERKYNFIKKGVIEIVEGDGKKGLPHEAPFDKILVSAASSYTPPELLKQLKIGGRMVIPVGGQYMGQDMLQIIRVSEDKFKTKRYPGFVFVPLV